MVSFLSGEVELFPECKPATVPTRVTAILVILVIRAIIAFEFRTLINFGIRDEFLGVFGARAAGAVGALSAICSELLLMVLSLL